MIKSNVFEPVEIRLVDTKEAMGFLKIGRTALETLVARGAIKPVRFNARLIRWQMRDLVRLANEGVAQPSEKEGATAPIREEQRS
jgi:hypothetical protein